MVSDLNRCEFIGRLGSDPVSRLGQSGVTITSFSIAVNKTWKHPETKEQVKSTQWIRVVTFRRLAEICAEYLGKGSRVFIAGEFQTRQWQDNNNTRTITEVIAREMQMLDSKPIASPVSGSQHQTSHHEASHHETWGQTHPDYRPAGGPADDDIPF